jgi:trehalose-phosphatase
MLDYDGTLAPFSVDRDAARPLPRTRELLQRIAEGSATSVAIVSGRPIRELARLVGDLPAVLIGEHGWERRDPGLETVQRRVPDSGADLLDQAERAARTAGWGDLIERKRTGLVLHTRSLDESSARSLQDQCLEAWNGIAGGTMIVDRIGGGVEVRMRGFDKGTAVLSLISQSPPATMAVFIGDDVTDEDAFDAVGDRGFAIRVGAPDRPSRAAGQLASCQSMAAFLEAWLDAEPTAGGPS